MYLKRHEMFMWMTELLTDWYVNIIIEMMYFMLNMIDYFCIEFCGGKIIFDGKREQLVNDFCLSQLTDVFSTSP